MTTEETRAGRVAAIRASIAAAERWWQSRPPGFVTTVLHCEHCDLGVRWRDAWDCPLHPTHTTLCGACALAVEEDR